MASDPDNKRILQIAYTEQLMHERATVLRRLGYHVYSVIGNQAAMDLLRFGPHFDIFIIGHSAPERTRLEMVYFLRTNHTQSPVVALNPPGVDHLDTLRYNAPVDDQDAWLAAVAAAAQSL